MNTRYYSLALALLVVSPSSCNGGTEVAFFSIDGPGFSWWERHVVRSIAEEAVTDVRKLLPGLPKQLTIRIQSDASLSEETGEEADGVQPNTVVWTVDPKHEGGVTAVARARLRSSLFHELHHLARDASQPRDTILDRAVGEGLATTFERDFAGSRKPWCNYPSEAAGWIHEIARLPPSEPREPWTNRHPDGRRWAAYQAGTYVVDRAMKSSKKSSADLALASTHTILALAN